MSCSLSRFLETNSEGKIVEISEEIQELLQSLKKEYAWGGDLYQYQGTWFFNSGLEAVLFGQSHFPASDTDTFLVTQPKAGTTWLKSLVFAIARRDQYAPSDPDHPLNTSMPHALVPSLEVVYNRNKNPDLSGVPSPRLFASHSPFDLLPDSVKNSNCRIIYLCRNPKDVFVSLWHYATKMLGRLHPLPLEDCFEFFCKGIAPNGPIWDHIMGYRNLSLKEPKRVLFLTYEDLKRDTALHVKKIAEFLDCPFSCKEMEDCVAEEIAKMCSFENLSSLEVNKTGVYLNSLNNEFYFRKGETGDWMNYLTPSMAKKLDDVIEQKLQGSGFSFS